MPNDAASRHGPRHAEDPRRARVADPARDPGPDLGPRPPGGRDRGRVPGVGADDLPASGRAARGRARRPRQSEGTFRRYRAGPRRPARPAHRAVGRLPKWTPADDLPERALATAHTGRVVVAAVDVDVDQATAFAAFTDPAVYSRWLGVPVTIDDGRFACTMEFGTRVRGRYDVVSPPDLIALRWDFEDDNVPVPGGEMAGYLRFHAPTSGHADRGAAVRRDRGPRRVHGSGVDDGARALQGRRRRGVEPRCAGEDPPPPGEAASLGAASFGTALHRLNTQAFA